MSSYEHDVRQALQSLDFIKRIVYRSSVESTNTLTESLARDGSEEWTVVVADAQERGRGRQGRSWHSPPGHNVYTSFMVKPAIPSDYVPAISLLAGMVVAIVLEHFTGFAAELKWPNDVLMGGKKISGILLELGSGRPGSPYLIVGIGINVNSDITEYPGQLSATATSMKALTGTTFDRVVLLNYLYRVFHEWYTYYCLHHGFMSIKKRYMQRLRMIHKRVHIESGSERITGVVQDVDAFGRLVLHNEQGETVTVKSGDVHITQ